MIVGFGSCEITPKDGKIPIAGGMRVRYSDEVHDPIYAKTIYLNEGVEKVFIVSCDICHPNKRLVKEALSFLQLNGLNITKEQLIICGTHATPYCYVTEDEPLYNGVDANVEEGLELSVLRRNIITGIYNSIKEAISKAVPCAMSYAEGDILVGFCRRMLYKNNTAVMYGNPHREDFLRQEYPDGGSSQYLYFYRKDNKKLYGVFAAVPSPAQADESSNYITADYWGVVRKRIEKKYGQGVQVVGVCRSAGELTPHRMMQFNGGKYGDEWGIKTVERVGNIIADSILKEEKNPLEVYSEDKFSFAVKQDSIAFPVRFPTDEEKKLAQEFANDKSNYDENGRVISLGKLIFSTYINILLNSNKKEYQTDISVIKIAGILFFTAPAELYTEYAKRIAMAFPNNPIFDVQLANDCIGYLPTKEAILHGGYSADITSALSTSEGGEIFVEKVKELLNEIKDK